MQSLAAEAGVAVGPLLYGEALGPRDSGGAGYLSALEADARAIVAMLGGSPTGCLP
jgi:hypothetical protein